jgi:hypothetical protein
MKRKVKCTMLVLIAILVWSLCLAKYLDPRSGIAVNSLANAIIIKVPYSPHISSLLNGYQLQLNIYNTCTFVVLAVLVIWRVVLLKDFWKRIHQI